MKVTEYLSLPELEVPVVIGAEMAGRVCHVLAVNFYVAQKEDCAANGLDAMELPELDRCALPAAVVEIGDDAVFHRLPHSLAPWVFEMTLKSHHSGPLFPAYVDFGIRDDRHYAVFF